MSHAIELEKVTKRFGNCLAVDSLDLIVPEGTIYGFIGPNGSGKTTTLRMILRILYPDSGRVTVLGCGHGAAANDHVGYLPEERGLYRKMRVRELLRFFAQLKGMRRCGPEIDDWLERFDLARWANEKVETLSKGMSQKVQFIASIVAKPRLLVLDEPFTGLDPVNMDVLRNAVRSAHQGGTTVIFSTHDMDVAERLCDTIFMIYRGKKVLDGTLAAIQAQFDEDTIRLRTTDADSALADLPGVIYAFVEIPADIFAVSSSGGGAKAKFYAQSTVFSDEKGWLQQALNNAVRRHRLQQAKIDPETVDRASTWVAIEGLGLFTESTDNQPKPAAHKSEQLTILLPFGIMMLMFMVILLAAQPMIDTVMEERSLRIAEVLLGSVSPWQLMAGKLLGCVAGSLTIVLVYGLGALGMAQYYDVLNLVPLGIVPWFLVYQVLAVLLFSSLFMAVGACVNDRKEAQSMLIPVMLLIVFPMFVWLSVVQHPTGSFAMWISFVPPGTALLMVLRLAASPDIPFWQPAVGVLILLAATGLCVFAAGRIFRIAILSQGQLPKFKQLLRWIVTG